MPETPGYACDRVLAAKSVIDRLGIDQTNDQDNSAGPQLLAQPAVQPPQQVALAVPSEGNLNPNALMPVVVQPRLMSSAAYTAPYTGAGRVIANAVPAERLLSRRSV